MGKTIYKTQIGLVEQLLLAMNPPAVAVSARRDFPNAGTDREARPEQVRTLDNKPQ